MVTDNNPIPREISSSLQGLFSRKNLSTLWQTYTLVQKWSEIAGKTVAKKSEPAYIQNNTLWVYVQSSVLMQHMQQQKLTLLEKINNFLPDANIQDIRWAMQPAQPASETTVAVRETISKPNQEERDAFNAMTSTVEDENCRKALQKFWQKYHNLSSE
jgi:hypothetical protein